MELQKVTLKEVETALRRIPAPRLPEVLTFIEFLEYRAEGDDIDDPSEDAALWAAVEANDAYPARHPGEMIVHESGEAFLAATADR